MKKRILIIVLILMILPIQARSDEIVSTEMATYSSGTYNADVVLEANMRMGATQLLIMPTGPIPTLGSEAVIISANMTVAAWVNLTLTCSDLKDNFDVSTELIGAVTIQVWVDDIQYAEAIMGKNDTEQIDIDLLLPAGQQTLVAISADRNVPEPMVPLPLNVFLKVELLLVNDYVIRWDVVYSTPEPTTTTGGEPNQPTYGLSVETAIVVIAFAGVVCAAVGARRKGP